MKKKAKITIALIAVLIVSITMIGLTSFYNPLFNPPATPTPVANAAAKALVIYDPNDTTGTAKNFAQEVTKDLQAKNYTVTLAPVFSSAANQTWGYSIIVMGGRFENGAFSNSTEYAMHCLVGEHDLAKLGIFTVQGSISPDDWIKINYCLPIRSDNIFSDAIRIQLIPSDDLNAKAQDFVNQII